MSDDVLAIALDDPAAPDVSELLSRHLALAREVTPSGHVHALEVAALKEPHVDFYSARGGGQLKGVAALKRLDGSNVELKSMHTAESQRGRGVGEALLRHLLTIARAHDYERIFLETGTVDAFAPARRLYQRMGFETCEPFGDYTSNPYSTCMIRDLHDLET